MYFGIPIVFFFCTLSIFLKLLSIDFSESTGGYIYADMSDSSAGFDSSGSITFTSPIKATCIQACFHMVGKHVSHWFCDAYYPFKKYVESEIFFFVSLLSKRDVT